MYGELRLADLNISPLFSRPHELPRSGDKMTLFRLYPSLATLFTFYTVGLIDIQVAIGPVSPDANDTFGQWLSAPASQHRLLVDRAVVRIPTAAV